METNLERTMSELEILYDEKYFFQTKLKRKKSQTCILGVHCMANPFKKYSNPDLRYPP